MRLFGAEFLVGFLRFLICTRNDVWFSQLNRASHLALLAELEVVLVQAQVVVLVWFLFCC